MKKLLGLLAGILCVLGLLAVPAPQEADAATGVSYVYFHYTNLVPGMKKGSISIKTDEKGITQQSITITQDGEPLSAADPINTNGSPVRIDIKFSLKDDYVFKYRESDGRPKSLSLHLSPLNYAFSSQEDQRKHNPDNVAKNSDGSFTATWNAVPVPKPAAPVSISDVDGKSFKPVVGEYPTAPNATSVSQYNHCKLVKYEWEQNATPYTGKIQEGKYYRLVLWLEAKDGYAFGSNTNESYWKDTTGEIWLANTGDVYDTWIYRLDKHPNSGAAVVDGTMVRVQIDMVLLSITTQPTDQTVTLGQDATFFVGAEGKDLQYQWQYRTSSTGTWKDLSAASAKTA